MSVTPDFVGQIYTDTQTGNLWSANSTTAGDWTFICSEGVPNITSGLVNWWKFDENTGTSAADSVGAANGTFAGGSPIWVAGKINYGLDFNINSGSHLALAANTSAGAGAFSVSFWLNCPNAIADGTIIYDSDNDSTAGFWISLTNGAVDGDLGLHIVGSSHDMERFIHFGGFTPNTWFFITTTWNGLDITDPSTVHIYVNSIEIANLGQSGAGNHLANTTANRSIGYGPPDTKLQAWLDDVRVYNRVLTQLEISNIFQWAGQP